MKDDWIELPKYQVLADRPQITHHKNPPAGVRQIAEMPRIPGMRNGHQVFYNNNGTLSIVSVNDRPYSDGVPRYNCYQKDFPLEFLTWFPQTLTAYRLPPGQSPYRGMTTPDMDVGGEMLSLSLSMAIGGDGVPGYSVDNWSRHYKTNYIQGEHFEPQSVAWTEELLFDGGLLALIEDLGQKWQKGIL